MTFGDRSERKRDNLLKYASGKHALRAAEAARFLGISVAAATRLLDELVESGAAERLRPIGCDHPRYDHYRLLEDPLVAEVTHEIRIAPHRRTPWSFGIYRKNLPTLLRRAAMWLAILLPILFLAVRVSAGDASDTRGDLTTLDGLVGRWMTLRTTLAEEKREWKERREQWEEEIALLSKEAETLKREKDEGNTFSSSFETKRAEALARTERIGTELRKLRAVLDRAESDLRRWRGRIPPGLMPSLTAGFGAIPTTQKDAEKLPLTTRAQTVAALYTQIETLQNQFHATRETLDAEGTRRQVDVLYVGLARAFAVSPGNDWAAVGVPADTGWIWTPSTKDAIAVRRTIGVLNRQATAQLIALPMQVAEEVKP